MSLACPGCKDSSLAHDLPAFWRSLPHESPLHAELAPPPDPVLQWLPSVVLAGVAILLLATGTVVWGVVALLAAGVVGFVAWRRHEDAVAELEKWKASMYCRHCDKVFERAAAIEAV